MPINMNKTYGVSTQYRTARKRDILCEKNSIEFIDYTMKILLDTAMGWLKGFDNIRF